MNSLYKLFFKIYSNYKVAKSNFIVKYWHHRYRDHLTIRPSASLSSDIVWNFANKGTGILICEKVEVRPFCTFNVLEKGKIVLEKNVFINTYSSINCAISIVIGENTMLGEAVRVYDHNHVVLKDNGIQIERHEFTSSPVIIGKNTWIGSNVTILKGVTIGDNVVIGAHNLIYKSIPSNSLVKSNSTYSHQSF